MSTNLRTVLIEMKIEAPSQSLANKQVRQWLDDLAANNLDRFPSSMMSVCVKDNYVGYSCRHCGGGHLSINCIEDLRIE